MLRPGLPQLNRPRSSEVVLCACRIMRPQPVPLTMAAVSDQGAYLMDCGRVFVMWLGRNVSPDFMTQVTPGLKHALAGYREPSLAASRSSHIGTTATFLSSATYTLMSSSQHSTFMSPLNLHERIVSTCHESLFLWPN